MDGELKARLAKIKLLLMDVDGTLTDGGIFLSPDGREWKRFHVLDGLGISLAHKAGLVTAIVSGRFSRPVQFRARELGIKEVHIGVSNKLAILKELADKYKVSRQEIAFIGDDLPDLPVFNSVGVKFAVANSVLEVLEAADIRTKAPGGSGAVREAIEIILKAQGKWDEILREYQQERWHLQQ